MLSEVSGPDSLEKSNTVDPPRSNLRPGLFDERDAGENSRLFVPIKKTWLAGQPFLVTTEIVWSPSSNQAATTMHRKTHSHASAAASNTKRSRDLIDLDCPGESESRHGPRSWTRRSVSPTRTTHAARPFATSGALTAHLRVHSGDKSYSCDTYGKARSEH